MPVQTRPARKFSITQNDTEVFIYLFAFSGDDHGWWKSDSDDGAFRDTGHGDQFQWYSFGYFSKFFNDIGLTDTVGQGHTIDMANADYTSIALTLYGFPFHSLRVGMQGDGLLFGPASNAISRGKIRWKFVGFQTVKGWQFEDEDLAP